MARRAAGSKGAQAATNAVAQVANSKHLDAISGKARNVARSKQADAAMGLARQARTGVPRRAVAVAAGVDTAARTVGIRKGRGQDAPPIMLLASVLGCALAIALSLYGWFTIDLGDSTGALPGFVPGSLVSAGEVGYAAYDIKSIRFTAFSISVTSGLALIGFCAWRRVTLWLPVAALLFLVSAALSTLLLLVLVATRRGYRWVLPDEWEPYSPDLIVEPYGYVFAIANLGLAILTLVPWARMRPRRGGDVVGSPTGVR